MRTCLIYNPTAQGEKAQHFRGVLQEFAREATLLPTEAAHHAIHLAQEAVAAGYTHIVAAGGDGTVNEVVNGIAEVSDALSHVKLGVLPLGTINVFAKELGLPLNLRSAFEVIRRDHVRRVDVATVRWGDPKTHAPRSRHFIQLAGAGLDSRAIRMVDWKLKKKLGPLAYIFAGMRAMGERQPQIQVQVGSRRVEGQWALVGNGRYYGGRFVLFPKASMEDRLLDVMIMRKTNWFWLARAGLALVKGSLGSMPGVECLQGSSIDVAADSPVEVEVEGDNIGYLPAQFGLAPESLQVLHQGH